MVIFYKKIRIIKIVLKVQIRLLYYNNKFYCLSDLLSIFAHYFTLAYIYYPYNYPKLYKVVATNIFQINYICSRVSANNYEVADTYLNKCNMYT